jgi:hypothetical protein
MVLCVLIPTRSSGSSEISDTPRDSRWSRHGALCGVNPTIWGDRKFETIESALRDCAESIRKSESIADSWTVLHDRLSWTAVLISKTLHFLCLSLGVDRDPPVPIDGAVIRHRVWPAFRDAIPFHERPENWEGNTFAAYSRYIARSCRGRTKGIGGPPRWSRTISLEFQPDWNRFCS